MFATVAMGTSSPFTGSGALVRTTGRQSAVQHAHGRDGITSQGSSGITRSREARYYSITASGRRALGEEVSAFNEMTEAIALVLNPEPESGH